MSGNPRSFLCSYPVTSYFALTFAVSWLGAGAVAFPHLWRHERLPQLTGILMFPAMLLGPSVIGIVLTGMLDGRGGLRDLLRRMTKWRIQPRWYAAVLIPPVLIVGLLMTMAKLVDPFYMPNLFVLGILFGVPAGLLEEIGWTGFAFHKMAGRGSPLQASMLIGLVWSCWHLPVVNYLGSATPHGAYWFPFFLAFGLAMTAMRVLISWLYAHTGSVLIAQLMHISSTGSLVVFSATHASARQEVTWYTVYGLLLWVVVAILLCRRDNIWAVGLPAR